MPTSSRRRSQSGSRRGFAAMDPEERREIARRGGEASHGGRGRVGRSRYEDEERGFRSRGRGGDGRRGFAAMDPEEQREIARMGGEASHEYGRAHEWDTREARRWGSEGGRAAHEHGRAHEWDPEEAREAGRRGGMARWGEEENDYRGRRSRTTGRTYYDDYEDDYRSSSPRRGRYYEEEDEFPRHRSRYEEDEYRRPMSREEAGRRGAEARWGRTYGGRSRYEDDDYRRPMSREEAGRRGAEARWGRSYEDEDED